MKSAFFATALFALAPAAPAEQLIGIESGTETEPAAPDAAATTSASSEPTERHAAGRPWESDGFALSSGVTAAGHEFGAQLTVSYGFNRYTAVDVNGHYARDEQGTRIGEHYGPEADFVVRYPNQTILTPFAGVGPGFMKWRRERDQEMFDDGSSLTANAYAGLAIRFSKNFGVQGHRRQTTYLGELPVSFADQERKDERTQISNNFGFFMAF